MSRTTPTPSAMTPLTVATALLARSNRHIVGTMPTTDPTLFSPLFNRTAGTQALRDHGERCLNCGGTGHSLERCRQGFLNTSRVLNPALGMLNDGSHAFRQWQQRMRPYRRGDYERHATVGGIAYKIT